MRKIFISIGLVLLSFVLIGCSCSIEKVASAALSEVTKDYFFADDGNYSASICVGERENLYCMDGVARGNVDFALISLKEKSPSLGESEVDCQLIIDGQEQNIELQFNPLNEEYMFDIGRKIDGEIILKFGQNSLKFEKISENFEISHSKAIDIGVNNLQKIMSQYFDGSYIKGECYLKIMNKRDQEDMGLLWCFTFFSFDKKSFSVLIDTQNGNILASDA